MFSKLFEILPDADENAFAYALPMHVLEAYHDLLDKKFSTGLTKEEEITLSKLDQQLDEAEAVQPLIQSMQRHATARDENWVQRFEGTSLTILLL